MPLRIEQIVGSVYVDGRRVTQPQNVVFANCITIGANSSVVIKDGTAVAAILSSTALRQVFALANASGGGSGSGRLSAYLPPTNTVYPIYYRQSYRSQLEAPGGSVGIKV